VTKVAANPGFAINLCDEEGDAFAEGVFLFFGDTIIKVAESKEDFEQFVLHLRKMSFQINRGIFNMPRIGFYGHTNQIGSL
jgi:hypothetical protein